VKPIKTHAALLAVLAATLLPLSAQETNQAGSAAEAYTRTITQRSDKIVSTLGIGDAAKTTRVRDIVVQQYRDLSATHDARDAQIKSARAQFPEQQKADTIASTARAGAEAKLAALHKEFLAKLSAELTPEQIDKVKDGMTYNVLHVTYDAYVKLYSDLTDEQKSQMMAWLTEAREIAMDQGSSEEKHAVFGKYKGRINNYLSRAGYDLKTGNKKSEMQQAPAQTE
jgi:hypothetical protein